MLTQHLQVAVRCGNCSNVKMFKETFCQRCCRLVHIRIDVVILNCSSHVVNSASDDVNKFLVASNNLKVLPKIFSTNFGENVAETFDFRRKYRKCYWKLLGE